MAPTLPFYAFSPLTSFEFNTVFPVTHTVTLKMQSKEKRPDKDVLNNPRPNQAHESYSAATARHQR